jgi:hypothetical protein
VDAAKVPRISITAGGAGNILLSWQATETSLVLQRSSKPSGDEWEEVPTTPLRVEGRMVVEESVTNKLYFYRLRARQQ